jgi:hypothetical protein
VSAPGPVGGGAAALAAAIGRELAEPDREAPAGGTEGTLKHRAAGGEHGRDGQEAIMDEADVGWAAVPPCRRCGRGDLVPLSAFGGQGAEVRYKAWVCTTPGCAFTLTIRDGEVVRGEPVTDASAGGRPPPPPLPGPRPLGLRPGTGTDGVGRAR